MIPYNVLDKHFHNNLDHSLYTRMPLAASAKNKKNQPSIYCVSHFVSSFNFIFFICVDVPQVLIRLHAHPEPTRVAKPRHSQSLLIPGRVSTTGCARGNALLLAAKAFTVRLYCEETRRHLQCGKKWNAVKTPGKEKTVSNIFLNIKLFLPGTGPDETYSTGPARHHALLIRTSFKFNKLRNVFSDREKSIMITSKNRAVSGPCHISPKKYHGLRTHGFISPRRHEGHEETRREENYKLQNTNYKQEVSGTLRFMILYYVVRSEMTPMGHEVSCFPCVPCVPCGSKRRGLNESTANDQ
jgi:hypothetical protein